MKIAYVVESASAGVGRHVIDLALSLTRTGHEIHVIYSAFRTDSRFRSGIASLTSMGGRAIEIPIEHGPHVSDLVATVRIHRYLRKHGPFDILHCHSTKAGLVGRLAGLGTDAKIIYTPHALLTMSPLISVLRRGGAKLLERTLSLVTAAIICVSSEEFQHASTIGIRRDRLVYIPNGIDLKESELVSGKRELIRNKLSLRQNDLAIGFVGRLCPQKAPEVLLKAFSIARRSLPGNVKLVIIGEGPLRQALQKTIHDLKLSDQIVLAGEMQGPEAMAALDLFVLTSEYEGFPYVVLEAIAAGLPVIATAVGGTSVLVRSYENGFVAPVGSVEVLARTLIQFCSQPDRRSEMSRSSLRIARQYTVDYMVTNLQSVYATVLSLSPTVGTAKATTR